MQQSTTTTTTTIPSVNVTTVSPNRLEAFEALQRAIPLNEFNLPHHLYRPDLIPLNFFSLPPDIQISHQSAAQIEINYKEGFPALPEGQPIWERLPYEDELSFHLFETYKLQLNKDTGFRQLSQLALDPSLGNISFNSLRELFSYYFWASRARAYDLFIQAQRRRIRELRLESCDDYHYKKAEQYLQLLEANEKEIFSQKALQSLTPMEALSVVKTLYELQRKALGADYGQGGGRRRGVQYQNGDNENEAPRGASVEVIMRSMAKSQHSEEIQQAEQRQAQGNNNKQSVAELLRSGDPMTVAMAQELVVRLSLNSTNQGGHNADLLSKASTNSLVNEERLKDQKRLKEGPNRAAAGDVSTDAFQPIDDLDIEMMS